MAQRYTSTWRASAESAAGSFDGGPISVSGLGGSVEIVGVAGATQIRASAVMVAGARSSEDAEAAFRDVADQLEVKKVKDTWVVSCSAAREKHGSVGPSTTGCDHLRVEVPTGAIAAPLALTARTDFGGIHASGIVVSSLDLEAPFGVKADVTPVDGARLRLWGKSLVSGHCSTELRVPGSTSFRDAALSVQNAHLKYVGVAEGDPEYALGAEIRGFAGAPSLPPRAAFYRWTRPAEGAKIDVELHASIGQALLTSEPIAPFDPMTMCKKIEVDTGG